MTDTETIENIEVQQNFDLPKIKSSLYSKFKSIKDLFPNKIIHLEIPIPKLDIPKWLSQQAIDQKIYWSERYGDFEIGGVGQADFISANRFSNYTDTINHINNLLAEDFKYLRYYGGIQFQHNENSDKLWQYFGDFYFILPRFEIMRLDDEFFFSGNLILNESENRKKQVDQFFAELDKLQYNERLEFQNFNDFLSREDFPDEDGWKKTITSALQVIENHIVEKVVLARKVILKFNEELNIYSLLHKLKSINPYATHFCFQMKQNLAFLGGSPELLYRRNNDHIYSEAIAGTRPRGKNEKEDALLERELLESDKERREHAFVVEGVKESLNKLCEELTVSKEISVIKLHRLQHLYSNFRGTLKNDVSDIDILSSLHPTPAVGGYPGNEALKQIKLLEPFHRGWYAAPVGWIGHNSAEFAVAIRSGLIYGKKLALFSGGGIVQGSNVKSEWNEIENKIENFLKALGINGEANS